MNKKKTWITLLILIIVGAFFNFYFTNMLMSGISNKDSPYFLIKLIAGFPGLFFNCEIIAAIFFVYRWYLHPTHTKKMLLVYGIVESSLAFVGLLFTIISGTVLYGSYVKPYPIPGFHILMTLWHLAVIALGLVACLFVRPRIVKEDVIIHKLNPKRVFLTIGLSLIYYFALNRFGAFIWSPIYIQWRTFGMTFVFYLSLLIPIGLIIHRFLYIFKVYDKSKTSSLVGLCISSTGAVLSIVFFSVIIAVGSSNPTFISAISPAVPIERLMTLPIDIALMLLASAGLSASSIYKSIKHFRKASK